MEISMIYGSTRPPKKKANIKNIYDPILKTVEAQVWTTFKRICRDEANLTSGSFWEFGTFLLFMLFCIFHLVLFTLEGSGFMFR